MATIQKIPPIHHFNPISPICTSVYLPFSYYPESVQPKKSPWGFQVQSSYQRVCMHEVQMCTMASAYTWGWVWAYLNLGFRKSSEIRGPHVATRPGLVGVGGGPGGGCGGRQSVHHVVDVGVGAASVGGGGVCRPREGSEEVPCRRWPARRSGGRGRARRPTQPNMALMKHVAHIAHIARMAKHGT